MSMQQQDQEAAAVARTKNRVSLADIKANIAETYVFNLYDALDGFDIPGHPSTKTFLVCALVLKNGFVVLGQSAPADSQNYNAELGTRLAEEDAMRKVWPLMGYALREKL